MTGIDLSETMVDLARERVPRLADSLLVAPVERLPFADGAFDAVTALGVLEFTEDVSVALRELARVLRPGGDRGRQLAELREPVRRLAASGWSTRSPVRSAGRRRRRRGTALDAAGVRRPAARAQGLAPRAEILLGATGATLRPGLARALAAQLVFAARKEP